MAALMQAGPRVGAVPGKGTIPAGDGGGGPVAAAGASLIGRVSNNSRTRLLRRLATGKSSCPLGRVRRRGPSRRSYRHLPAGRLTAYGKATVGRPVRSR